VFNWPPDEIITLEAVIRYSSPRSQVGRAGLVHDYSPVDRPRLSNFVMVRKIIVSIFCVREKAEIEKVLPAQRMAAARPRYRTRGTGLASGPLFAQAR
jgi:hypothetical protein